MSATERERRVAVAGLGVIGRAVALALDAGLPGLRLVAALARDRRRAEAFLAELRAPVPCVPLDRLVADADIVVEASTRAHLEELAPVALGAGRDLVVLSCGALLDHPEWVELARARGARIHVPSGAIAGLDAMKGAAAGTVTSVTVETRKPPRGLAGAPGLAAGSIDLDALSGETLVFEGPAREACRAFPANVNVLAAVALAGVGPERTRSRIYAVPGLERNRHRVLVEGEFGSLTVEIANVPSENPRTGRLSYLSTIALLRDLGAPLRVGT